ESVGGRGRGCIASQSLLPGLEKVFRPAVIEVLDDPLAAAELGDAVLAAQAFQYNADLVFRREVSPRRATDLLHDFSRRFFLRHGFLSHLRSMEGYDEPEILPSSTHPICLMSTDGGQSASATSTSQARCHEARNPRSIDNMFGVALGRGRCAISGLRVGQRGIGFAN